jgi:exopolyphosphatase/guanosine-5'-triphosphate,3'-diphosphate pyrophosphatase
MAPQIRAVIDVGTNSVKLLVASVDGSIVRPLEESSEQTRLGHGFYETHSIQPAAIRQTAETVARFATKARAWNPASIRVIGTSAARDAINRNELVAAIEEQASLPVSVISGEQEADWAFRGVATDPALATHDLLVIDIGGGSTEFTAGHRGTRVFGNSFKLGTVRYLERSKISEPPTHDEMLACAKETRDLLQAWVKPVLQPVLDRLGPDLRFIGSGGTNTIVARIHLRLRAFNRELIDGATLSREEVRQLKLRLWRTPLEERRHIIGLPSNRADVILPGVVFVDEVMDVFRLNEMRISTRGLRFAALMD